MLQIDRSGGSEFLGKLALLALALDKLLSGTTHRGNHAPPYRKSYVTALRTVCESLNCLKHSASSPMHGSRRTAEGVSTSGRVVEDSSHHRSQTWKQMHIMMGNYFEL